jgi:DnaJ-class molecular chaperone
VLGIKRGTSKAEVSAAFRKQMLMYHPDVQSATSSEAEKQRYAERSKLITEAYRKIKSEMKR